MRGLHGKLRDLDTSMDEKVSYHPPCDILTGSPELSVYEDSSSSFRCHPWAHRSTGLDPPESLHDTVDAQP